MSVQIPHAPSCTCSECQVKKLQNQAQPNQIQGKKPKETDLIYEQIHRWGEFSRGLEKRVKILEDTHNQDPKSGRVSHIVVKSNNQPIKSKQGGRSVSKWILIVVICGIILWILYAAFMMATGHKFMLPQL